MQPPPTDGPRTNVPYAATGSIHPEYRLWEADVLALRFFPSGGRPDCAAPSGDPEILSQGSLIVPDDELQIFYRSTEEVRLPLELARRPNKLRVIGATGRRELDLPSLQANQTWESFREQLSASCAKLHMSASLMPVERSTVASGDRIVLIRQSLISDSLGQGDVVRRESERFELVVDAEGYVTLPQVTRVPEFPITDSVGTTVFPKRARINSALEAANARLLVTGAPLPVVAKCLSAAAAFGSDDDSVRCAGIDARYAPTLSDGESRTELTYILEPGPRSWVLVDEENHAIETPYVYGLTLAEAVETVYRARRGLHLLRRWRDRAYLTVIPRDGTTGSEKPFFGVLTAANRSLERILLMPGDTVHVTYVPPYPIPPWEIE